MRTHDLIYTEDMPGGYRLYECPQCRYVAQVSPYSGRIRWQVEGEPGVVHLGIESGVLPKIDT